MPYTTLLFDIDDTLLDFKAAEHFAISTLMTELSVEASETNVQTYSRINQSYWEEFEKGLIAKDVLVARRFETFFALHDLTVDGSEMDGKFRNYLEQSHHFIPGTIALLDALKPTYSLYATTNGVARTQHRRIKDSGLIHYFQDIFVSEETGHQKPTKEYFDYVFARIPNFSPKETLIIGDSLTSDILGGINAGIDTCWFNPNQSPNPFTHIKPTYEITSLAELQVLLEKE